MLFFPLDLLHGKGWCHSYLGSVTMASTLQSPLTSLSQTPAEPLRGTAVPGSALTLPPAMSLLVTSYRTNAQQHARVLLTWSED